jgi:hypothetical protein
MLYKTSVEDMAVPVTKEVPKKVQRKKSISKKKLKLNLDQPLEHPEVPKEEVSLKLDEVQQQKEKETVDEAVSLN